MKTFLKSKEMIYLKGLRRKLSFFENIRFYAAEEKNESNFSKHLASFADLFVNDAFSCSHRTHASVCKITEFLPSFAGLQFETEVNALKKVLLKSKNHYLYYWWIKNFYKNRHNQKFNT